MSTLLPQEVYGNMTEHREDLRTFVFTNPAGIFIKGDVEDPMQCILNTPVLPHGLSEPHALGRKRGEKIPRFDLHRLPDFTT